MIEKIAEKDFDVDQFVQIALSDDIARAEIVHQMLENPAIMVYYHCYYVVEKASRKQPVLFYSYWAEIAELLHHKNSYHRDFALDIIGNLAKVDQANQFSKIADEYFAVVSDEKFMTGNCCVRNLGKIYRHKPEYRNEIVEILLDIDKRCDYTEKQKAVLKADVIEILEEIYTEVQYKAEIEAFIRTEINSISPKTRKKAQEVAKKFSL